MFENYAESILNENLFGGGGGSNIKSIQRGSFSVYNQSASTFNINIEAVEIDKSIILCHTNDKVNLRTSEFAPSFIDSQTVRFERGSGAEAEESYATVFYTVIEFENIKSKQTGTMSPNNISPGVDVTINEIDPSKSLLFVHATAISTANLYTDAEFAYYIKNATTITLLAKLNIYLHYQLIEFK